MNESVPAVYVWSVFSSHCWSLIHDKDHVFEITEYGYKGICWTQWDLCWTHAFFMIMLQWSAASVSRCTKVLLLPRVFSLQLCGFRFFFFFFLRTQLTNVQKRKSACSNRRKVRGRNVHGPMWLSHFWHDNTLRSRILTGWPCAVSKQRVVFNFYHCRKSSVVIVISHHTHIHSVPLSVLGTITSHIVSCIPTWVQR